MHFCLSISLFRTFQLGKCSSKISTSVPEFLLPLGVATIRRSCIHGHRSFARRSCQNSSTTTRASPKSDALPYPSPLLQGARFLPPDASEADAGTWISTLDRYLPAEWRHIDGQVEGAAEDEDALLALLAIIYSARKNSAFDLLKIMGVELDRWDAVLWVVENLLPNSADEDYVGSAFGAESAPTRSDEPRLDEITRSPLPPHDILEYLRLGVIQPCSRPHGNAEGKTDERKLSSHSFRDRALREVWQSLGSMILSAAESPSEKARTIMDHVYLILAHLHHANLIPDDIYMHNSHLASSITRRPPTLHILSSRILSTLSDAVWKAQEKKMIDEALKAGISHPNEGIILPGTVPGARYKLRMRQLGPEIWLELVLWACIEGGFIIEASWILVQVAKRKGPLTGWSLISWDSLQRSEPGTSSYFDAARAKSRWSRLSGGNEGYSAYRPIVEMGTRTISKEVVTATIDGLISITRTSVGAKGEHFGIIYTYLKALKLLLERNGYDPDPSSWSSIIVRLIENRGIDPDKDPAALEHLLALASTSSNSTTPPIETCSFIPSMFCRVLDGHVQVGNVRAALRTFSRLKNSINRNTDLSSQQSFEIILPVPILFRLLDLLISSHLYSNVNKFLLDPSPLVPIRLFTGPILSSLMIRYATIIGDKKLLQTIIDGLRPPFEKRVVRALLQSHVRTEDWEAVDALLRYNESTGTLLFGSYDIAMLAAEILYFEFCNPNPHSINHVVTILRLITSKNFDSMLHRSDKTVSPEAVRCSLLFSTFQHIPSPTLQTLATPISTTGFPSSRYRIPIQTFNIILGAIIDYLGSSVGLSYYERYADSVVPQADCEFHGHLNRNAKSQGATTLDNATEQSTCSFESTQKVVMPSLRGLRFIERGAIRELEYLHRLREHDGAGDEIRWNGPIPLHAEPESSINALKSVARKLREFGLKKRDILWETRGFLKSKNW